ncbi:MAG: ABC transporter substrate-binding protein [Thermodesulfobacteriota bacterium]
MSSDEHRSSDKKQTRREFLVQSALTGAAIGAGLMDGSVGRAAAAQRDYILIGHPNPTIGAIAEFGEVSPWADERALAAVNGKGGIYVEERGKSLPVRVQMADTQSDPKRAAKVAAELIKKHEIDIMVVMHTPDTVNPVSNVCDDYGVPCVSMVVPLEAWLSGGPYKWCYHAFWSVDSLSELFLGMWDQYADRTTKVFGGLWPDDPDGKVWADVFTRKLTAHGYRVVDPGRIPFLIPDYSEIITRFKQETVDIVGGVVIPPDWTNFWRQSHQDGFNPKMVAISKAIPFPSAVHGLEGRLADGLMSELWWSPYHPFKSALTGETSQELCDAWTKETGKQWTMPLGFASAGIEVAVDAIRRARSLDKQKIREALAQTNLDTTVGRIKFDVNHCSETPLVGGQWAKGAKWPWELGISYNERHPEIPKTAQMVFPIPARL